MALTILVYVIPPEPPCDKKKVTKVSRGSCLKELNKNLLSILVLLLPKKVVSYAKKVYEEVSVSLVCLTKQLLRF